MKLLFRIDLLEFEANVVLFQMVISSFFRWKGPEPFPLTSQRVLCTEGGYLMEREGGKKEGKNPKTCLNKKGSSIH